MSAFDDAAGGGARGARAPRRAPVSNSGMARGTSGGGFGAAASGPSASSSRVSGGAGAGGGLAGVAAAAAGDADRYQSLPDGGSGDVDSWVAVSARTEADLKNLAQTIALLRKVRAEHTLQSLRTSPIFWLLHNIRRIPVSFTTFFSSLRPSRAVTRPGWRCQI